MVGMGFSFLTSCPVLQSSGVHMCWVVFSQGTKAPCFPQMILGRVTGVPPLKLGSWEWGECCFRESSHYLGKCLLHSVNDGEVEKTWSCGKCRGLSIGAVGASGRVLQL